MTMVSEPSEGLPVNCHRSFALGRRHPEVEHPIVLWLGKWPRRHALTTPNTYGLGLQRALRYCVT